MRTLFRSCVAIGAAALLTSPIAAFAATKPTLEKQLDTALRSFASTRPLTLDGTLDVYYNRRPLIKKLQGASAQGKISSVIRLNDKNEAEGRFSLDSLQGTGADLPIQKLDAAIPLSWKVTTDSLFFRIDSLPDVLKGAIQSELKTDPATLIGTWMSAERNALESQATSEVTGGMTAPVNELDEMNQTLKDRTAGVNLLQITRVEKKTTDAQGHNIYRLAARISPSAINTVYARDVKALTAKGTERRAAIKQLDQDRKNMRELASKTHFVMTLDSTAVTLKRVEASYVYTKTEKQCDWNTRTDREVCKNAFADKVTFVTGVSQLPASNEAVAVPSLSTPVAKIWEMLNNNAVQAAQQ